MVLLRECHTLPRSQTALHCYSAVGRNDTASQNLGRTKEGHKALGLQAKNAGVQAIFSSILPVRGKGTARN